MNRLPLYPTGDTGGQNVKSLREMKKGEKCSFCPPVSPVGY